jgi:hypothetical protein
MDLYRVTLGDRSTFLMRADMTDAAATGLCQLPFWR